MPQPHVNIAGDSWDVERRPLKERGDDQGMPLGPLMRKVRCGVYRLVIGSWRQTNPESRLLGGRGTLGGVYQSTEYSTWQSLSLILYSILFGITLVQE